MRIEKREIDDVLELTLTGRLDAMWSDHLQAVVAEAVRGGSTRIRADLSGVTFLSSAGIGALVAAYQEVSSRHGVFWLVNLSDKLEKVLDVVGLLETLTVVPEATIAVRLVDRGGAVFHVKGMGAPPPVRAIAYGDPSRLSGCRFGRDDVANVTLDGTALAVGVGAFGDSFDDARERFGELVSVAGSAIASPTDGSGAADFVLGRGGADAQLLYGIVCEGRLSAPAWFEAKKGSALPLGELAKEALELSGSGVAAIVVSAEPDALVGAALKRSPAMGESAGAPFDFPEVRRWLSFTSEGGGARRALLAAGVVARGDGGVLAPHLRPFAADASLSGHVHGATFQLRGAARRAEAAADAVAALFEQGAPRSVLHLLADDRAGETRLLRGTLWYAPIEVAS